MRIMSRRHIERSKQRKYQFYRRHVLPTRDRFFKLLLRDERIETVSSSLKLASRAAHFSRFMKTETGDHSFERLVICSHTTTIRVATHL